MKLSVQHYFEFLSLLLSLIYVRKLKSSFMISFVPYLLLVLVIELVAKYLYVTYALSTGWMYNILNLISHFFYAFIFYRFSTAKEHRQTIILLTTTYIVSSIIYYAYTSFTFNNYIIAYGGIIQVIFACLHFYEYLLHDNYVKEKHYSAGLFIASGVLIFYSGITICLSLYNYILLNHLMIFNTPLYNIIPRYLSIILYSCISIALIVWRKPMTTS